MAINLTKKQANTLFVVLIIIVIAFMIITINFIYSYKDAITSNPLSYGVKKMNLGQCTMTCYSEGSYQPVSFSINSTSISQDLKGGLLINYNG